MKEGRRKCLSAAAKTSGSSASWGNLLFWFQNNVLKGGEKKTKPRQLICSALFNSVQEDESKQNQQLPLWWSSDLHRLFTCLSTTSFSSSHVIQKGGQIRADKLIDNKLLANVELKQLNLCLFFFSSSFLFFSFLMLLGHNWRLIRLRCLSDRLL